MPFRETPPQPQMELPTEQVPLEEYVRAKRAHIEALRTYASKLDNFHRTPGSDLGHYSDTLTTEAQVLEYDLQNFLFTVKQHQLAEQAVKEQQQQQIITATLARKPGRLA